MLALIKLLLQEQFDLGQYCLECNFVRKLGKHMGQKLVLTVEVVMSSGSNSRIFLYL